MIKILDFWAEWCGPCKKITKELEEVQKEKPNVEIEKINIDDNPECTNTYKIKSVPTLIFMKDNQIIDTLCGFYNKNVILDRISKIENK